MLRTMKFGECLHYLLTTLDISVNRLSKAINIDNSLISRWVNGKRIPSYKTIYIDTIAEFLAKNFNNSYQVKRLNDLYLAICKDTCATSCIKDKIKYVLSETQGYSLECRKQELKVTKAHIVSNEKKTNTFDNFPILHMSHEDTIIIGKSNIINKCNSLLVHAAKSTVEQNATIYISFVTDNVLINYVDNKIHLDINSILNAINNGYKIVILIKFNNDIQRTIRLVQFILPIILTGKLVVYYFKNYTSVYAMKELMVVEGIGTVMGLPTESNLQIDHALVFKNNYINNICANYYNMILNTYTNPLIDYYTNDNVDKYQEVLNNSEESIGDRLTLQYGFNIITMPDDLYLRVLKRHNIPHEKIQTIINHHKIRLQSFFTNIRHYTYKDIYTTESIINLIKHRKFCFYCREGLTIVNLETDELITLLQNLVYMLKTFENYNIAFLDKKSNRMTNYISCTIKELNTVLFESYSFENGIPELRLAIKEPMIIKACEEYFREIWNSISPIYKEKNEIINWLLNHIKLLSAHLK